MSLRATRVRWAALGAVVTLGVAMLVLGLASSRYEARLGVLAREAAAAREAARRTTAPRTAADAASNAILADPGARVLALVPPPAVGSATSQARAPGSGAVGPGTGPGVGAAGRLVWSPTHGGVLAVRGLTPAPAGHAYVVWLVGSQGARAAGSLEVVPGGTGGRRFDAVPAPAPARALVTLEPTRGGPAPRGPVVLVSP